MLYPPSRYWIASVATVRPETEVKPILVSKDQVGVDVKPYNLRVGMVEIVGPGA